MGKFSLGEEMRKEKLKDDEQSGSCVMLNNKR